MDILPRSIGRTCRRPGHIAHLQVFDGYDRVVFAYRRRDLVQEIAPDIGNTNVNLLDAG
jgi:hypothetical protein